jgi:hypothetical protein
VTQPPQSGPWGAQPPQQPGNWQGYPAGQPGPQGQWNPQQQWPSPTPAPQKKGPLKWILGATALIAVIAVTAVVAVSCAGGNGTNNGGGNTPTSGSKSDIASANDTGPVSVITEDPSCAPWNPIITTLANAEKNGWDSRDPSISTSSWTPEVRSQYQAVGEAMRNAATQTSALMKITTHRVVRELYEQFIAYSLSYADKISNYSPSDNDLAIVESTISDVITGICQSIANGSAAARSPLIPAANPPTHSSQIGDATKATRFIAAPDSQCQDWKNAVGEMTTDPSVSAWSKEDPSIPASGWSPEYRAQNDAVKPVFSRIADRYESLARQSSNATVEDFGVLAAQYGRAFVQGIPTYTNADLYLFNVFQKAPGIITAACRAAGTS